jgi:hypothetical protein
MCRVRFTIVIAAAGLSFGCDQFPNTLGYANRLRYPVTIVEHVPKREPSSIRLAAGQIHQWQVGVPADTIDIMDSKGRLIGHHRVRDIPRQDPRGDNYIIITSHGVRLEFSPEPRKDQ